MAVPAMVAMLLIRAVIMLRMIVGSMMLMRGWLRCRRGNGRQMQAAAGRHGIRKKHGQQQQDNGAIKAHGRKVA